MSVAQRPEPRRNLRTPILETKIKLPTDQPCQIYPRVSTPEQKKNVSAEMQQDKSFAIKCGWTEDLIIIDKRDLGVSGQLRMEDREAFRDMLRRMPETAGKERIRAVIVRDVSRLFRNKWGDEPGKFMEICYRYNVLVVTADFVYDFSVNWHIDKFKRKCEEAWSHIENHVYGVMLPARDERAYAGYWTGGNLPVGYSLDRREKIKGEENSNYNKFIIYEKHAKVVRWIFRRYKQLNGNVRALLREIERLEKPLFPDFDEDVPEEVVSNFSSYKKVPGGYTIASDATLRRVLTNRVYIGYWVYCGELVSTNNHPAIVDYDDFMFAYNRLSPINLDGTPNGEALRNRRKYARRFTVSDGLLKECIEAADPELNVYPKPSHGKWNYGLYKRGRSSSDGSPLSVFPCREFDDIVLRKLVARMMEPQAEKDFAGFLAYEDKAVTEASETLNDIERDIIATKALIKRTFEQVKSGKFTDPDLAQAANDSYIAAKAELERLEARKQDITQIASEDEERRTYKALMQEVGEAWEEIVMPDEHPRLVHLFIKSVTVAMVSPSFFSATVEWIDPSWGKDTGFFYKGTYSNHQWTEEEIDILEAFYPTASQEVLTELLPRRSRLAMSDYYRTRGLPNPRPTLKEEAIQARVEARRANKEGLQARKERVMPYNVCLEDWKIMQEYHITKEDMVNWKGVKLINWFLAQAWRG
jgi:DNA invertase Pin-like site-specific DNA recombinase